MYKAEIVKDMMHAIVCNHKNLAKKTLADWTIIVYFESKLMRFEIYRETFFIFHIFRVFKNRFTAFADFKTIAIFFIAFRCI